MINDAALWVSAKQLERSYVLEFVGPESHTQAGHSGLGATRPQIQQMIPSNLRPYLEEVLNDLVTEGYLKCIDRKGDTHFIGGLP